MDQNIPVQPIQTSIVQTPKQPEGNTPSNTAILLKIVLGLLWMPIGLVILFISSYMEYSSSNFWIFYAQALISTLVVYTIIFIPYFLMLRKYSWKWGFVVLIIGLSMLNMFTSKISYFFPPIPVYQEGISVNYSYEHSSMGEFASNNIFMRIEIPNGTDVQVRKNVAMFYKQIFARRGYKLVGSYSKFDECSDYVEKLSPSGDEIIDCAIVDSSNGIQLHLIFYKNFVSIEKDI